MQTTHKISEDFYEENFTLLAVHSSLEDYTLAYAINAILKTRLRRVKEDLDISDMISFPYFEWKDELNHRYWTLITNTNTIEEFPDNRGLFQNESAFARYHLIPEYKEVDYFLKIEEDEMASDPLLVKAILTIPEIITAYPVDISRLKSRHNLIF